MGASYNTEHRKFIYPEVLISLEADNSPRYSSVQFETYIRLKYRGKYYLCKVYKDSVIKPGIERETEIMMLMKHFYSEVYRYQTMMKVDLKMVIPQPMGPDKPVFELDPDQSTEEERLNKR